MPKDKRKMDNEHMSLSENISEYNIMDNETQLNDSSKAVDGIEEEKSEERLDTSILSEYFNITHHDNNKETIKDKKLDDNSEINQNIIAEAECTSVDTAIDDFTDNLLQNESENEVLLDENVMPRHNKQALPSDCKTYMLETFKKNIMIIFNHEFVNGYERREGTNVDVAALINTFRKFRFDIELHKDRLRKEVGQIMVEFSGRDFTEYGCIAVTVLTHGSEKGGLRARDKKYREQQILELLKENPTVATKPIMYIIQACRDTKHKASVDVVNIRTDNRKNIEQYKLPMDVDTLKLHSTYKGKFAYRESTKGSWFIQTLCEKIEELADEEHIESIMVEVKREVALNKEAIIWKAGTNEYEFNKQMPVTESTLIRKLFLKRSEEPITNFVYPSTYGTFVTLDAKPQPVIPINRVSSYFNQPCNSCIELALDQFDYVVRSLEYYLADHPNDERGQILMVLAKTYNLTTNKEANEAKISIAKDVRDHIKKHASDFEKYKYFYPWKDVDLDYR